MPTYSEMVTEAIVALRERNGSSVQAIKKHIITSHSDLTFAPHQLRSALKKGTEAGKYIKVKNSYKLSPEAKKPPPKVEKKPANKPEPKVTKKPEKQPKPEAPKKKPTATKPSEGVRKTRAAPKKPAPSAKKPQTKKPAAKATRKKPAAKKGTSKRVKS